jgi:hypothetical protein
MIEDKHWKVEVNEGKSFRNLNVVTEDGSLVAWVYRTDGNAFTAEHDPEAEARARAIAALPRLLRAAQQVLAYPLLLPPLSAWAELREAVLAASGEKHT